MSQALSGGNHHMLGKSLSAETKALISANRGTDIFVYDTQGSLVNSFSSGRKAALHFKVDNKTIMKYVRNNELFQDLWKLTTSLISKE
jgi:group I intron endonuclease